MAKSIRRASIILFLFTALTGAQTVTSSLLGTVNDASGLAVPGAEVRLSSQTTSGVLTTNTNTLGLFRFPVVQPDTYRLTIAASGFKNLTLSDIELTASETWDWYTVHDSEWSRSLMGNIPKWFPINNSLGDQVNYIPDLSFGGTPVNTPSVAPDDMPYYNANNIYTLTDNLSKVIGRHSLKAGVYFEPNQKIEDQEVATWLGNYSFSTDANNPFDTGNSFANALLGNSDTYTETNDRLIQRVWFTDLEFYLQDNWRVSKRLTVDIGIRFYHVTPQADQHNAFAAINPALYSAAQAPVLYQPAKVGGTRVAIDPVTGQTYPAAYIGLFVPGTGNPADGAVVGGQNGVPHGLYEDRR